MTEVSVAFAASAELGECPIWSKRRQRLLWVDTLGGIVNLFDPLSGENVAMNVPAPVGFVAEDGEGKIVVGVGCDVGILDENGSLRHLGTAPHGASGFRLNDARYDQQGRLWVGLMDNELTEGSGRLYRFDPDGRWHEHDSGFTLVNGLDWSPDQRTLYVTDSRQGEIYAYDFEPGTGETGPRRSFFHIDAADGKPDGLVVDPDGYLLSVLFDGSAILRIAPNARVDRRFNLPVPRPTSCALSVDGRRLYVTTARLGLDKAALAAAPLSGALLTLPYTRATGGDGHA